MFSKIPLPGLVSLGDLRRLEPMSRRFGIDRGKDPFTAPVDRYHIERFLAKHALDIQGNVLEFGVDYYTRKFGGDRVKRSDVLCVRKGIGRPTIIDDLTQAKCLRSSSFDCIICTQTLQFIFDVEAAIATLSDVLRPGGVILATFAGISQISRIDMQLWGDCWRFTTFSARKLFEKHFAPSALEIKAYGNVLSAVAFLVGLSAEELTTEELEHSDPDYELLITVHTKAPGH